MEWGSFGVAFYFQTESQSCRWHVQPVENRRHISSETIQQWKRDCRRGSRRRVLLWFWSSWDRTQRRSEVQYCWWYKKNQLRTPLIINKIFDHQFLIINKKNDDQKNSFKTVDDHSFFLNCFDFDHRWWSNTHTTTSRCLRHDGMIEIGSGQRPHGRTFPDLSRQMGSIDGFVWK